MSTWTAGVRLLPLWTRLGVLVLGVCVCMAEGAAAQTPRANGPFAGLFGGGKTVNTSSLDFRTSLFGVWQDVTVPSNVDPALLDPVLYSSSTFTGANASLSYNFSRVTQGTRINVSSTASVAAYSLTWDSPQYSVNSNASLSTNLTRRITFSSGAGVTYSPYLSLASPFGSTGDVGAGAPSISVATAYAPNFNITGNVGLMYQQSRRGSFYVDFNLNHSFFLDESIEDLQSWGSRAGYQYSITRNVRAHAGYSYTHSRFGGVNADDVTVQGFDFGIDYGDALRFQLTRRTLFTFSPGLSAGASGIDGTVHYAATGVANLSHIFGRTWSGNVQYARSLGFVPGFQDLVLSDMASASLTGLLMRRVSSVSGASWYRGDVGVTSNLPNTSSYTAYSGISVGLTHRVGAFVQYTYFKSSVPAGLSSLYVVPDLGRQSVVAGLSFFAPIFNNRPRTRQ